MSGRPSMQFVQRSLLIGIAIGAILGCMLGAGVVGLYIRQNPPVYQGGAYPNELTEAYQNHYLAIVVDSYIVNQQAELAAERLKTFDNRRKILVLGERAAAYVAAGRSAEAQLINNLAVALRSMEGWDEDTIRSAISELSAAYQADPARSQAISTFSANLLGEVPITAPPEAEAPPVDATPVEGEVVPVPAAEEAGTSLWTYLLCCLGILVLALIGLLVAGRIRMQRKPAKSKPIWEGEGPAPLKQWTAVYELGKDNFEDFAMLETDEGDFLGESGMGIREAVPGTSPKQVTAFEVGLFDKTDITTLNKIIMSEGAYHDEAIRAKVEANPQDEAIMAEPGKEFTVETTAMRVEGKIEDVEYGNGGNNYFTRLAVNLKVFLKEGVDVRKGEMDVPDEYRY